MGFHVGYAAPHFLIPVRKVLTSSHGNARELTVAQQDDDTDDRLLGRNEPLSSECYDFADMHCPRGMAPELYRR
jgi:hypothetical protein